MQLTRRDLLVMGSVGMGATLMGALPAIASLTDDEIAKITGGADVSEGDLAITAPEIAENGNTVPIEVTAPGAVMVAIFADGNPVPNVASVKFGPMNPSRSASTRIRLAKTQNVVAIAQMEDGSFQKATSNVKVTIGGCGG
ncbi:thiosulfate oxidation carrier protein SoxY [uncultured Shimia sp.]|uniref:thiosulfate oxidation carrier protein SoxY n=1 Tax=uncultured Shimia sp. TaxID=573152 RepID=UPI0026208E55|nr:thiosulfate oxidation carrier protein SoxY [uncultured Shimia sp.]